MFNSYRNRNPYMQEPQPRMQAFATASVICAVFGIFTMTTGIFPIVFGSLAVVFSFLSKGSDPKLGIGGQLGRYLGIAVIGIGVIMIIVSFRTIINEYGSLMNYYYAFIEAYEETYGVDLGL